MATSYIDELLAPTVLISGFACLGLHLVFTAVFAALPEGPWTKMPGFLAHQVVAFPLMVYMAWIGSAAWFAPDAARLECSETLECRMHGTDPTGKLLAQIIVGMQVLWDIPTNLLVPSLFSPIMIAHHLGMAAAGFVGLMPFSQFYFPFFTGVIEISSIPLAIVDIFHPSKFGKWTETSPILGGFNLACRLLFVLSFLVVRMLLFPYYSFFHVTPDLVDLLRAGVDVPAAGCALVVTNAFTLLQLYWGVLILRQLGKMLKGKTPVKRRESFSEINGEQLSGRKSSVDLAGGEPEKAEDAKGAAQEKALL